VTALTELHTGWQSCLVHEAPALDAAGDRLDGETLSRPDFEPAGWRDAIVPGTVLTTLLTDRAWLEAHVAEDVLTHPRNQTEYDPYFDRNLAHLPDVGDRARPREGFRKGRGRDFYTCWYRLAFDLSDEQRAADHLWLRLRGINYVATLFVNGHRLDDTPYRGMFLDRRFDIGPLANADGPNALAVCVEPLDHPGIGNGINGTDGEIARDVSMQYIAGWDWVPPIPDRNTGIWDRVELLGTGTLVLRDPQVITHVSGERRPNGPQSPAELSVAVDVVNAGDHPATGRVQGRVEGTTCAFESEINLAAGETRRVTFDVADFPQLRLEDPRLWWPHGYGEQPLYNLHLCVHVAGGNRRDGAVDAPSDETTIRFGIREIRSEVPAGMARVFRVNGRRIFVRGGNWVGTDALLRGSVTRYRQEVELHRAMNLNMIRIWGGTISERPEFYDACDELGLLVMQDFWITGDGNGAWEDPTKFPQSVRRRYPDDHELFLACARDTIKMLRNHASLCFWCGGNEIAPWGYAENETAPPTDLNGALAEYIGEGTGTLDSTRVYVPSSADAEYIDCDGDGLHGHGPYGYQEPEDYLELARGFTTEIGTAAVPVAESLRRMFDAPDLFPEGQAGWGTAGWDFHNEQNADTYGFAVNQYGKPTCLEDFALQSQLVNAKSYQGIFEAWNTRLWDTCSGLLIWKSQNCWPNLRSQIYDWYLEPTGGYFSTRRACSPICVQLDLATRRVGVCNTTSDPLENVRITATWHDLSGTPHVDTERVITVGADSYQPGFRVRRPAGLSTVHFLELQLRGPDGESLADNVYWFSRKRTTSPHRYADLQALRETPVTLETTIESQKLETQVPRQRQLARLRNPTEGIAFAIRLKLLHADGTLVQPTFYGDNYITLFGGQEQTIAVEYDASSVDGNQSAPVLHVEGWNIDPTQVGSTT
jgi:mannosylglycoprotein endo-beta-mannosidase